MRLMPPSRGVQANGGEVIAWRILFWGLSDAMVRDPKPWIGDYVLPNMESRECLSDQRHDGLRAGQVFDRADRGLGSHLSQQPRA
jgi:hypothetical protein